MLTNQTLTPNYKGGTSMDERQEVENIMKNVGLERLVDKLEEVSIIYNINMLTSLRLCIASGIGSEISRADVIDNVSVDVLSSFPPSDSPPSGNICVKSKEPLGSLDILNNKLQISNPIVTGKSIPPLEAKRQAVEKRQKNVRKTSMPKKWADDRERGTIDDPVLLNYAEGQGYDWYQTKEMFLAFVDYHESKGSKFVKWNNAFFTWVRNDLRFNGPATKKVQSCDKLYKKSNPLGELFHD